eukprot:scaffold14385_cov229-Ochromonas_danica.AAC.1
MSFDDGNVGNRRVQRPTFGKTSVPKEAPDTFSLAATSKRSQPLASTAPAAAKVDPSALKLFAKVEVRPKGSATWQMGRIANCNPDGSYDVRLNNDETIKKIPREQIRAPSESTSNGPRQNTADSRTIDKNVRIQPFAGGGEEEKRSASLGPSSRKVELTVGMAVEANYRGKGQFYPGKIKNVRLDGTYDVVYEDGDSESRVPEEYIRVK